MMNFYMKYKKKIIICSFLLSLFFGGFWSIKYNLPNTVEFITGALLEAKIKSTDIDFDFKNEKIVVRNLKIEDEHDIIVEAPKVDIYYSLEELKVKKISVDGGNVVIVRRKNGDINIVSAFTGSSPDKTPEEEKEEKEKKKEEEYVPGIPVPIDIIEAKNITTIFRDESYSTDIEVLIYDTAGYVTFSSTKGLDLNFAGHNGNQLFDYSFNNYKEPYWMRIKLTDIVVNPTLLQYGYDGEYVSCDKGNLNMDLEIASSGLAGWIDYSGVELKYKDLDDVVTDIKGRVDFNEKGIFLKSDGLVFGKREDFKLSYENSELNLDFNLKQIAQKNVEKLSYLNGIELPFKDTVVDEVDFNLNYKKDVTITVGASVKDIDIASANLNLADTKAKFIYDKDGMHLNGVNTTLTYYDKDKKPSIVEKLDGDFIFDKDVGKLDFKLKNINDKKYIPNIAGNFEFELKKDEISFNFLSNIVSLKGGYSKKDKKVTFEDPKKYLVVYDLEKSNLVEASGKLPIQLLKNRFLIDFKGENNILTLNRVSLFNELGRTNDLISGEINLEDFSYKFNMNGDEFKVHNILDDKDEELVAGRIKGSILGKKSKVNLDLDLKDLSVNYLARVRDIDGKLKLSTEKSLELDFNGEIGEIGYDNYSVYGLLAIFRLKDNVLQIKSFNNQYITVSGSANFDRDSLYITSDIKDMPLSKFDIDNPKITIKNLQSRFYGNLSDIRGTVTPEILIEINDGVPITLGGDISYMDKKFITKNLKINNNVLKGEYSLATAEYWLKGNIIQEDIGKYYGNSSLKYRVIGTLNLSGKNKDITSSIKTTIDKIYIKGNHLPNVYVEAKYESKELVDGVISLDEIILTNNKLENLLEANGFVDLKNKNLHFDLEKQNIRLRSLEKYIPLKELTGEIILNGEVDGSFEDINYSVSLYCDTLKAKEIELNKIKMKLDGDLLKASLREFSFRYQNNLFTSKGEYDIKNSDYSLDINSEKINLSFLNAFLNKYKVEDIVGNLSVNLNLTKEKNSGYLKISKFGLKSDDLYLKLNEFNSTILIENDKLIVDHLNGKFNDGMVKFKGDITMPPLNEITDNPYFYEKLEYQANLELDNVFYKYDKYFNLTLNSNLNLKNQNLFGEVEIVKGEVLGIPTMDESIFSKIKKFLFGSASETVNESETLGKDFKIETAFSNSMNVNIRLKIREGIQLKIDEIMSLVQDVKGNVVGNGVVSGNNGKYIFLGNVEVLGGSLNLNDNQFNLNRVLIAFNDRKTYFPKFNPRLLVDASVQVQNETMDLGLNGPIDNLRFNIRSKNGNSSGSLNSLLTGEETDGKTGDITATLVTNIIGGQVTQILKPVSKLIKNTFGLSKFRITSNFINEEQSKNNSNGDRQEQLKFKFGAALEAEDNIYKNKLFWVAKANILGDDHQEVVSDSNSNESSSSNSNGIKDYDFSLEYRFDATKSLGVGVNKVPEKKYKTKNKGNQKKLNYHIDFKFQKKYDNLLDIFINK